MTTENIEKRETETSELRKPNKFKKGNKNRAPKCECDKKDNIRYDDNGMYVPMDLADDFSEFLKQRMAEYGEAYDVEECDKPDNSKNCIHVVDLEDVLSLLSNIVNHSDDEHAEHEPSESKKEDVKPEHNNDYVRMADMQKVFDYIDQKLNDVRSYINSSKLEIMDLAKQYTNDRVAKMATTHKCTCNTDNGNRPNASKPTVNRGEHHNMGNDRGYKHCNMSNDIDELLDFLLGKH